MRDSVCASNFVLIRRVGNDGLSAQNAADSIRLFPELNSWRILSDFGRSDSSLFDLYTSYFSNGLGAVADIIWARRYCLPLSGKGWRKFLQKGTTSDRKVLEGSSDQLPVEARLGNPSPKLRRPPCHGLTSSPTASANFLCFPSKLQNVRAPVSRAKATCRTSRLRTRSVREYCFPNARARLQSLASSVSNNRSKPSPICFSKVIKTSRACTAVSFPSPSKRQTTVVNSSRFRRETRSGLPVDSINASAFCR